MKSLVQLLICAVCLLGAALTAPLAAPLAAPLTTIGSKPANVSSRPLSHSSPWKLTTLTRRQEYTESLQLVLGNIPGTGNVWHMWLGPRGIPVDMCRDTRFRMIWSGVDNRGVDVNNPP
jgi:hypothetical protein